MADVLFRDISVKVPFPPSLFESSSAADIEIYLLCCATTSQGSMIFSCDVKCSHAETLGCELAGLLADAVPALPGL